MGQASYQFEVWGYFSVSRKSEMEIFDFFKNEIGIPPHLIVRNLHLSVYHARRPMPNLQEVAKRCHLTIDTMDLRFMVMAPGGENPRPNLIPARRKVGVRVIRTSSFRGKIYEYRNLLIEHETPRVLGRRKQSTKTKNAFGARHFQPHITLLNAGTGIDTNLTIVGDAFRDSIQEIHFDKFVVVKRKHF